MVSAIIKSNDTTHNRASDWEGAAFLIDLARERQRHTQFKFVSGVHLPDKLKFDIRKFIRKDPIGKVICTDKVSLAAAERLILRFEELCRRRDITILSQSSRKYSYRLLLIDLHINSETTGISPKKLVTTTLLNSELICSLFEDKSLNKFLSTSPSFIEILTSRNPADLRGTLEIANLRTQSILKDPKFKLFSAWPAVVRRIVLLRGNTYKEYLSNLQKLIESELKKHGASIKGKEAIAIDAFTKFCPERAKLEILKKLQRSNGK